MNNKFDEVISLLRKQGKTDEEILDFSRGVTVLLTAKFNEEMGKILTEEDAKAVGEIKTQEEKDNYLRKIFEERTGQKAEDLMDRMLSDFGEKYLEEISKLAH